MSREEIIAANPLVPFLRRRGHDVFLRVTNHVTDACPVTQHKPGHRPVMIYQDQQWYCHDCKRGGSVIDWLMIEQNVTAAEAMRLLSGGNNGSKPAAKLIKTYDYTDESGALLFQVCRYQPKGFNQRRPDGKGNWIWNLRGVRRVLYRLPEVLKAQTVLIAEGEKDCDNLQSLGFTATTNPCGAGKWRPEYSETLHGKEAVVFGDVGDEDGAGEKHTVQVIKSLQGKAKSIKHVSLPDGFHDVSDYIGSLPSGTAAEAIRKLIDETPQVRSDDNKQPTDDSVDNDDRGKSGRKSAATRLIEFAAAFRFFHDAQDRPFVRLEINGHTEIWPVESSKFRKLLARTYYQNTKKAINRNALADAITTLAGCACHDSPEEPVFLRVAPYGEDILIDLCDQKWRVVLVTANGWQILDQSPVAFVRTGSMQALPEPRAGGGSIEPLWQLLNVTKAQRPLVAGGIINAFHPSGPYFVMNYVGEHGSAKSSGARMHRQTIDPNHNPLRSPPKEENDLFAQAVNNRCVALDNLSYLPLWLSDALCRIATGGGLSKRTLYTDIDETSIEIKRPVIINGIEDVATRPDLADRVLQIELETIPKERRITEKVLWREFEKARPLIFTAILDAVSTALRILPQLKMPPLPRMADAAEWATAGEMAFGFKRWTFLNAYQRNLDESAETALEANSVGAAIRDLLEKQDDWKGTPRELVEALDAVVSNKVQERDDWPENPQQLGQILRRIAPALRRAGIGYERPVRGKHRTIRLFKAPGKPAETAADTNADFDSPHLHVV